jgi:heptose-I-phosphate ethanolaminephosphotransferase
MTKTKSYKNRFSTSAILFLFLFAASLALALKLLPIDEPLLLPVLQVEETKTLNGVNFPSKVWIHRVNTVERARLILTKFAGIEIDVFYDSSLDVFDVRPRDLPSVGLYLERYFDELDKGDQPLYWIDIKNLSRQNELEQFLRLDKLAEKYNLKKRMIVESPNTASLTRFTDAGFITSYYLPHFDLKSASTEDIVAWVTTVKDAIGKSRIHAISADFEMYPLIEKYFNDADSFLWSGLKFAEQKDRGRIKEVVGIENVKVFLAQHRSAYYR